MKMRLSNSSPNMLDSIFERTYAFGTRILTLLGYSFFPFLLFLDGHTAIPIVSCITGSIVVMLGTLI
jgi:hypothetical protein